MGRAENRLTEYTGTGYILWLACYDEGTVGYYGI